jgi:hypothetical protein
MSDAPGTALSTPSPQIRYYHPLLEIPIWEPVFRPAPED